MKRLVAALLCLLSFSAAFAAIGPPGLEACRWEIKKSPCVLVFVERDGNGGGCDVSLVEVVTIPPEACAWEVHMSPQDTYFVVNDSTLGGCSAPTVRCVSGDCP